MEEKPYTGQVWWQKFAIQLGKAKADCSPGYPGSIDRSVLRTEPGASCLLGKCFPTESQPSSFLNKKNTVSLVVRCSKLVTPAHGRLRQEGICTLEASLDYIAIPCLKTNSTSYEAGVQCLMTRNCHAQPHKAQVLSGQFLVVKIGRAPAQHA